MVCLVQVLKQTATDFVKGFDPSSQVSFKYIHIYIYIYVCVCVCVCVCVHIHIYLHVVMHIFQFCSRWIRSHHNHENDPVY